MDRQALTLAHLGSGGGQPMQDPAADSISQKDPYGRLELTKEVLR